MGVNDDKLFRKIYTRILPLVMVGFFLSYLDRVNVGFAKLEMSSDLGFSEAVFGLGAGVFFIGYFIFEVPSNLILAKVGARKWIARIMVTWGIISGLMFFVDSEAMFYTLRFLLGVAEAGFIPGVLYYMSQWFPASRRGRAWGIFYLALALSGVIGGPLSGIVLNVTHGAFGIQGWQWLFLIEAIPTIILGFVVFFFLREDYRTAPWLDDAEKARLGEMLDAERPVGAHMKLSEVFRSPLLWLLALIYFSYNFALYGIGFWLPSLIQGLGISDTLQIGFVSAIPSLAAMVAMVAFGFSSDRHGERKKHIAAAFALSCTGFIICVVAGADPLFGIIGLSLANAGALAIPAIFWSFQTAMLTGTALAGGIALINSTGNLAGFAAPYLMGFVRDTTGSSNIALLVSAGFMVLGATLVLTVRASRKPGEPALAPIAKDLVK
jgi:D-galactonate transporter